MILPFEPATISFKNVQYFVKTNEKKRQLLKDMTGAFRPGVLTALMGVTGAGKTTLMDVLSGRKNSGVIEGKIKINGYPKVQSVYSRISAYCEQTDVHYPLLTIEESVKYSAWLRLPSHINQKTKSDFVSEVLGMVELEESKNTLVGTPGVTGISTEQRKRLTIAVELVSNPSIIFMDEPTSGLDARSAAIVMRTVKKIVSTKRTVVCTIHQPSIDIFDAFDELFLMKRGGQIIYAGALGLQGCNVIEYFEGIDGVSKIKPDCNPATWMLEITSPYTEARLGLYFAQLYKESHLCRENKELVESLTSEHNAFQKVDFANGWVQFKACLWKQHLSYWRSPKYNLARLIYITCASALIGALLWKKGQNIHDEQDLFNIVGTMFLFVQFLGVGNCSSILPFIGAERCVVYRERFSGMYSSWAYSSAQAIIELPYIFLQTVLFVAITYPAINLYFTAFKIFWYFYTMFCSLLYFSYLGMLLVSSTPNYQVAAVYAGLCYTLMNLFSGYLIPQPEIPRWWAWCYWICPTAWSLRGILTSQYGDIQTEILAFEQPKILGGFLQDYFGYDKEYLGISAIILLAYPIIFAFMFAIFTEKLIYQRR